MHISKMEIKGFKSIQESRIVFNKLNVLIGSNGAGKSNLISLFRMFQQLHHKRLQIYIGYQGGPDNILYYGRKVSAEIYLNITFDEHSYGFILKPTSDNKMIFEDEWVSFNNNGRTSIGRGHFESIIEQSPGNHFAELIKREMTKCMIYHFNDTGDTAPIKGLNEVNDNQYLRADARNLAAILYLLQETKKEYYVRIVKTIRLVAPYFDNFILRPSPLNKDKIELEWQSKDYDIPFKASQMSDGMLRFISLVVLLLQPDEMQPQTIIIDEPELGLHPYALVILSSIIKTISKSKQLVISTQSVDFLDEFSVEDIIVVNRENNKSVFKRLHENELRIWLDDGYSLGDLWKKNIIGGRPSR